MVDQEDWILQARGLGSGRGHAGKDVPNRLVIVAVRAGLDDL
jgi:hypothetical protein